MEALLKRLDGVTISCEERLRSIRDFLERHKDEPNYKEHLEAFLTEYEDVI